MWSVFCEWEPIEVTLSDSALRTLAEATALASLALSAPSFGEEEASRTPQVVLQVTNQSGCPLRCSVRSQRAVTALDVGGVASVFVPDDPTDRAPLLQMLSVEVDGVWHTLPPLPNLKAGAWTLLARPPPSAPTGSVAEPVALQCVVRPLGGVGRGDNGVAVSVRSLVTVHNTTNAALHVQVLHLPRNGRVTTM